MYRKWAIIRISAVLLIFFLEMLFATHTFGSDSLLCCFLLYLFLQFVRLLSRKQRLNVLYNLNVVLTVNFIYILSINLLN